MSTADLVIYPRWLIPVEPAGVVHENHALVVDAGRILDILPADLIGECYQPSQTVKLPQHALIPGLVNAHTHASMSLLRGLADDIPLHPWLHEHIWPAEKRWMGPEFVRDGTELAIAEMLRSGTTCFNDMYFFPEVTAEVARRYGIRSCLGMIVVDFPTAWGAGPQEYIAKGTALRDQYRDEPLLSFAFAPHAPYSVADNWFREVRTLADELDVPIHTHVHETAGEISQSMNLYGKRPLARLAELGMLTPDLVAVHMTQLMDDEIAELAAAGVHVVHCPESNLKLASGFCPVARLLASGVNVALGTDSAASNNDLDMIGEMRSAALLAKGVAADASALAAAAVLRMATLNGARALGLERDIGSLAPGKSADLAAIDLGGPELQPLYNPLSQLIYAANRAQVSDVWVAGRRLLRDGELTQMDIGQLMTRVQRWQKRLSTPLN
ncbi:MAG: TRZ/ATZ family hydrolase [Gammaproteobacteria bacterium]|nr:TRZ/ATZ family hydrolase [Gammaproteobacteria bacterium]MDE2345878.1 TRZ/ATZ family hydrolase [Gammaproteobacteria bacterium]